MNDIVALLHCLAPYLSSTTMRQMKQIVFAVLCIPDRVTMLSIARWTERGGSYRTVQRWYHSPLDWATILWTIVQVYLLKPDGECLLAGDEVVISKAGNKIYGRGRFYSSLAQRPINSVSFMAVSLIDVQTRQSYPLQVEQREPPDPAEDPVEPPPKHKRGRPKAGKNHVKPIPKLTPDLTLRQGMITAITAHIAPLTVQHIVLDGHFGNYPATYAVRETGLHIISKLRHDAALYLPYAGPKPKRGPTPRYGQKLNYNQLPPDPLCHSAIEDEYRINTYQLRVYHKSFSEVLKVVIVVKTHLETGKRGHVVLFSTDLDLTADQIVDYYSLRFQIEFNFRDGKQYWYLDDFMNVKPVAVTNAVNLAFLMVNLSAVMLKPYRHDYPDFSVLDLKAQFCARRYLDETIKMLPDPPSNDLVSRIWRCLTALGGIRVRQLDRFAA
ncbi:MAG TPA: transposase [Aggregatilineaceae bacterium]|nr:transposase [Aggregatilineaceae bacterium]